MYVFHFLGVVVGDGGLFCERALREKTLVSSIAVFIKYVIFYDRDGGVYFFLEACVSSFG